MAEVVLEGIRKSYGELEVVHGIDLQINNGEFVVLVGPSGCGKSTTLRMIAGLEEISDGQLKVSNKVLNDIAPKDRDMAMVFQNYALYPHMSVYDNISFSLKLRGLDKSEIDKKVNEASDILGLKEYLYRRPSELSGGQRQRVAMGRAIVRDPKVFLFDEPLSNLDAKLRNQMRAEIKKLHHRMKNTIIYVTHDQVEAMTLADKIVVMKDGYISQVGRPLDIYQNPKNTFVAGFIGSPPMNLIEAKANNGDIQLNSTTFNFSNLSESDVQVGIRPEFLSLEPIENSIEIKVEIDLVETLGGETLLHFLINDQLCIGRFDGYFDCKSGDQLCMYVQKEKIHIFNNEGLNINFKGEL